MKWTNPGHQFDHLKDIILEENVQYYIWGAAVGGKQFYEAYRKEIKIIGFIDGNPDKEGQTIGDVKIHSQNVLDHCEENVCVLIATAWKNEVLAQLSLKGFQKNVNCFLKDEFHSLYSLYKYQKISHLTLVYPITQRCSLSCQHCVSFMPYYKNPQDIPKKIILKSFDLYFSKVDHVHNLTLTGGDAMIHPEFHDILKEVAARYYPKKASQIIILTNGILLPCEETLKLLAKYDVLLRFTNFKEQVETQQLPKLKEILSSNHIRYEEDNPKQWVDFGYPQESNGSSCATQWTANLDRCQKSCITLREEKVVHCANTLHADEVGYCPLEPEDYIDLNTIHQENKTELLEFILGFSHRGYVELCKKCNGNINGNKAFVEPGMQTIKRGEKV